MEGQAFADLGPRTPSLSETRLNIIMAKQVLCILYLKQIQQFQLGLCLNIGKVKQHVILDRLWQLKLSKCYKKTLQLL